MRNHSDFWALVEQKLSTGRRMGFRLPVQLVTRSVGHTHTHNLSTASEPKFTRIYRVNLKSCPSNQNPDSGLMRREEKANARKTIPPMIVTVETKQVQLSFISSNEQNQCNLNPRFRTIDIHPRFTAYNNICFFLRLNIFVCVVQVLLMLWGPKSVYSHTMGNHLPYGDKR